jgi:hypothetical protein
MTSQQLLEHVVELAAECRDGVGSAYEETPPVGDDGCGYGWMRRKPT